jgi:hypothetical protein
MRGLAGARSVRSHALPRWLLRTPDGRTTRHTLVSLKLNQNSTTYGIIFVEEAFVRVIYKEHVALEALNDKQPRM